MYYRYEEKKGWFYTKRTVAEAVNDDHHSYVNGLGLRQNGEASTIRQIPGGTFTVVPFIDRWGRRWE